MEGATTSVTRIASTSARLLLGATLIWVAASGQVAAHAGTSGPVIVSLTLNGVVDPFTADYITSNVARARADGAEAVLLTIDTPGGLGSSMNEITQSFLTSTIPVIAYVAPSGARAASAGAFILLSAPVAAMAPATNVGASTPIGLSGGDISGTLGEKVRNDAAASMRTIQQTYGRNADLAETFVTDAASITAEEALQQKVINLIARSTQDLVAQLDGKDVRLGNGTHVTLHTAGAVLQDHSMGGFVDFLHNLLDPNLAFIFFWIGLGLIVLELIIPGHIFSGTIGTILLILSIASFGLLPVRFIGILFLIASVVCFVIELGVSVSPWALLGVAAFAGVFFGIVVAAALKMRHQPSIWSRSVVGQEGVALSAGVGAKGGVVRVASEEWRAVAPSGPIQGGARVRVIALDGLVLTVEPSAEHAEPEASTAASSSTTSSSTAPSTDPEGGSN
ncbi:MAG: nodulation protein NfeD [Actinobacteria bacterium]|nr:MAG: nodulation protein NfeD [Actinomycetota bacterium]